MFVDGKDFEDIFQTPQGPIQVMADTHIFGDHLVLDGMLFFPEYDERLKIGVRQTLAIIRNLRERAKSEGFQKMSVSYHRIGEGRHGQTMVRTRGLT